MPQKIAENSRNSFVFLALSRGKKIAVHFVLCRSARGSPASALPFASLTALLSQSLSPFGRLGGRVHSRPLVFIRGYIFGCLPVRCTQTGGCAALGISWFISLLRSRLIPFSKTNRYKVREHSVCLSVQPFLPDFPMSGRFLPPFSKGWKRVDGFFQTLERFIPRIGKNEKRKSADRAYALLND